MFINEVISRFTGGAARESEGADVEARAEVDPCSGEGGLESEEADELVDRVTERVLERLARYWHERG